MSIYYRDCVCAILVFDYSNRATLDGLKYWLNELNDRINTQNIIIKIVGNKFDTLEDQEDRIDQEEVEAMFKEFSSGDNFELINTSAKTGLNILYLFNSVAKDCFELSHKTDNN